MLESITHSLTADVVLKDDCRRWRTDELYSSDAKAKETTTRTTQRTQRLH
jgi:hypothetical protein